MSFPLSCCWFCAGARIQTQVSWSTTEIYRFCFLFVGWFCGSFSKFLIDTSYYPVTSFVLPPFFPPSHSFSLSRIFTEHLLCSRTLLDTHDHSMPLHGCWELIDVLLAINWIPTQYNTNSEKKISAIYLPEFEKKIENIKQLFGGKMMI